MPSLDAHLKALFDAERAVRTAHEELAHQDAKALLPVLQQATRHAMGLGDGKIDEAESSLRLVRIASILGDIEGGVAVDLLIDILGSDSPEARHESGEELGARAWERFKEVALGIERALERLPEGNLALLELPYILAEIPEPGVLKLLGRFLAHKDVEAVASTIEAIVETGDPDAIPLLAPFVNDRRKVQIEDDGGTEDEATIGELATEAMDVLTRGGDGGSSGSVTSRGASS
jgi:HEAT repeat protein